MKAIVLEAYGTSKNLRSVELATPVPKENEVLVRIHAAAVNPIDLKKAAGAFKDFMPLPFPWTPGVDFSGTVESVGTAVKNFTIGDEVYGEKMEGGTYAEYIAVDQQFIALKPHTLNFTEAASVPVAAETAWQVLFQHAKITAGQTVLIHGAAGAVGAYAVQFAHQAGAKVIATASAVYKDFLESLGADVVIDYKTVAFESVLSKEGVPGKVGIVGNANVLDKAGVLSKVDAVIDTVGGDVLQRSYAVIKAGGWLVSLTQPVSAELAATHDIHAIFSQLQPSGEELSRIAALIDSGKLTTNPGNVYPLQQAAEAWNYLAGNPAPNTAKKNGRVVLQIR